ncbi:hypothetical protein GCM10020366_56010 [Saccharopolyspora gregorii]|uniref:Uncharacterized protein n=1 Tax=Saccharopolyspora gregorii TaxID=33914 RepID=A0ABP6RYM2_9PSEU
MLGSYPVELLELDGRAERVAERPAEQAAHGAIDHCGRGGHAAGSFSGGASNDDRSGADSTGRYRGPGADPPTASIFAACGAAPRAAPELDE